MKVELLKCDLCDTVIDKRARDDIVELDLMYRCSNIFKSAQIETAIRRDVCKKCYKRLEEECALEMKGDKIRFKKDFSKEKKK